MRFARTAELSRVGRIHDDDYHQHGGQSSTSARGRRITTLSAHYYLFLLALLLRPRKRAGHHDGDEHHQHAKSATAYYYYYYYYYYYCYYYYYYYRYYYCCCCCCCRRRCYYYQHRCSCHGDRERQRCCFADDTLVVCVGLSAPSSALDLPGEEREPSQLLVLGVSSEREREPAPLEEQDGGLHVRSAPDDDGPTKKKRKKKRRRKRKRRKRANREVWSQETQTEEELGGGGGSGPGRVRGSRCSRGTGSGSTNFFIIYLMALPLLSFTSPASRLLAHAALQQQQQQQQSALSSSSSSSSVYANSSQLHPQYNLQQGNDNNGAEDEQLWPRDEPRGSAERPTGSNNEYWPNNQLNPWRSKCDLSASTQTDHDGNCIPPESWQSSCPFACSATGTAAFHRLVRDYDLVERLRNSRKHHRQLDPLASRRNGALAKRTLPEQCLFYLEESHVTDICRHDFGRDSPLSFLTPRENRYWFMAALRLRHCCEHTVVNALTPGHKGQLEDVLSGGDKCKHTLNQLLQLDAKAASLHCQFEDVLSRYDCAQSYSIIFNCTHCKEAYRKWMCSSLVPYFAHGEPLDLKSTMENGTWTRLQPCRTFCQSVEQRCPYLLPGDRAPAYPTQYAGEPTFLCRV